MIDDDKLEWARAHFAAHAERRRGVKNDDERRQCAHAALAVAAQLVQAEFGTEAMSPLQDLLAAMQDIEQGRQPKLLKPVKRRGRPQNELAEVGRDAAVAASVEILYRNGTPLTEAEQYVARHAHRKAMTAEQVKTIREKIMGFDYGKHSDDAYKLFRAVVDGAMEDQRENGRPAKQSVDSVLMQFA